MGNKLDKILDRAREMDIPESNMVIAQLKGLQDVGIPHDILQRAIDQITELESRLKAVEGRAKYFIVEFRENWKEGRVSIDCKDACDALDVAIKGECDE